MNKSYHNYYIEVRFQGKARSQIKRLISKIDKKCNLDFVKNKIPVPHITLVAPFKSNNEKKVISLFNKVCTNVNIMDFEVDGFDIFEKSKVVYLKIHPSKELEKFRLKLSQEFSKIAKLKLTDYYKKYYFHSTLVLKLSDKKFKEVQSYINNKQLPKFKHCVIRITLMKGSIILREYDLLLNKSLNRTDAKSKIIYSKSIDLLTKYIQEKPKKNIIDKIKEVFSK